MPLNEITKEDGKTYLQFEFDPDDLKPGGQGLAEAVTFVLVALVDADLDGDTISPGTLESIRSARNVAKILKGKAEEYYDEKHPNDGLNAPPVVAEAVTE